MQDCVSKGTDAEGDAPWLDRLSHPQSGYFRARRHDDKEEVGDKACVSAQSQPRQQQWGSSTLPGSTHQRRSHVLDTLWIARGHGERAERGIAMLRNTVRVLQGEKQLHEKEQ
jgi:hypothetical protein